MWCSLFVSLLLARSTFQKTEGIAAAASLDIY